MLRIALPKGNLQEDTVSLFRDGLLEINGDEDDAWIKDKRIAKTAFFRAQEIAKIIENGDFDIGITGYDWILETDAIVTGLADLDYGRVRLVNYVRADSDMNDPKDVRPNSRVSSEYERLPRRYFDELGVPVILLPSYGATEQKVSNGMADVGFDNTCTGSTIKKAGLKIIGDDVLSSSARLIANKEAYIEKGEEMDEIRILLEGVRDARDVYGLKMNIPECAMDQVLGVLPSMEAPTIARLYNRDDWYAAEVFTDKEAASYLIPELKKAGAKGIVLYKSLVVVR